MIPFTYSRAADSAAAIRDAAQAGARYLGGGTNLVDLMREGIERPSALVDVTGLDRDITELADGVGAMTASIGEQSHFAVGAADHDDRIAADPGEAIIAGLGNLAGVADEDPSAMKHAFHLVGENLLVGVNAGMNAVFPHEGVVIEVGRHVREDRPLRLQALDPG